MKPAVDPSPTRVISAALPELTYTPPDSKSWGPWFRRARMRLKAANQPRAALEILAEADERLVDFVQQLNLVRVRRAEQPLDELWRTREHHLNDLLIELKIHVQGLLLTLSEHRLRDEIEALAGPVVFREGERLMATVSLSLRTELQDERAAVLRYLETLRETTFSHRGQEQPLSCLSSLLLDPSRDRRQRCLSDWSDAMAGISDSLQTQFTALIENRQRIADRLGYRNYYELGIRNLGYSEQLRQELARFLEYFSQYFMPLISEMRRLQRKRLQLDPLFPFDAAVLIPEPLPQPTQRGADFQEALHQTLTDLFAAEAKYFEKLLELAYWNFDETTGCFFPDDAAILPRAGAVYINSHTSAGQLDLSRLFTAAGTACADAAGWFNRTQTFAWLQPQLIRRVCADAVVFLSYRSTERFFNDGFARLWCEIDLSRRLLALPLQCAGVEFEAWVYDHPEATAEERNLIWQQLEKTWLWELAPLNDNFFSLGMGWLSQSQLVAEPLHLVDPLLSLVSVLSTRPFNPKKHRLENGLYALLRGVESPDPVVRLTRAGFRSPFEEETFKRASFAACDFLGL